MSPRLRTTVVVTSRTRARAPSQKMRPDADPTGSINLLNRYPPIPIEHSYPPALWELARSSFGSTGLFFGNDVVEYSQGRLHAKEYRSKLTKPQREGPLIDSRPSR